MELAGKNAEHRMGKEDSWETWKKEKFSEEKMVDGRMQHDACWWKKNTLRLAWEGMRP